VTAVATELREIQARKGIKLTEVAEDIRQQPILAQDLPSKDAGIPNAFQEIGAATH
jgi:hypothetical protein